MLAFLAAALAASIQPTPATPAVPDTTSILESSTPWWERITVTVDDKGTQRSCRYQTSHSPGGAEACDEATAASIKAGGEGQTGVLSKVTFERRFSPDGQLDAGRLQPGDTLFGRQVMFLTIDAKGAIESCHVVSISGESPPGYGCNDARKEQFRAAASTAPAPRQAFMTILAYGHTERIA